MVSDNPASEGATIDQLVESFVGRLRQGEEVTVESYQQQYPHLADEIGQIFPSLQMLETCRPQEDQHREGLLAAEDVPPNRLGDYRIVREIGRGGMGIVYEAEHENMQRRVALKVLPKSLAQRSSHLARFQLEARSAGQLHHSNIVPVFEVGEENGFHFYAMQFIRGQNLDLVIEEVRALRKQGSGSGQSALDRADVPVEPDQQPAPHEQSKDELSHTVAYHMVAGKPTPAVDGATKEAGQQQPKTAGTGSSDNVFGSTDWSTSGRTRSAYFHRVAALGMQVADALSYAHHNRLLHRDIKPANLILDTDGTVWVTDFGLAKGNEDDLTQTGDIVGTLRYMAPERFQGETDAKSDIYSLGLTLYELCTLHNAFENSDRATLVEQVTQHSPAAPRSVDPSIPRDLETIILKAIDRSPDRRYRTARELGEDLHAFLSDRPIHARRISVSERLFRLCRRNPVTAALSICSLLLLVTAAVGASLFAYRLNQQSQRLKTENDRATSHLRLTEDTIDGMLQRFAHDLTNVPQTGAVREELFGEAIALQKQLLAMEQGDASVALGSAKLHRRMAKMQKLMGDFDAATAAAEQAIALVESVMNSKHATEGGLELSQDRQWFELGLSQSVLAGVLSSRGHLSRSAKEAARAIESLQHVDKRWPAMEMALAQAFHQLGVVHEQSGKTHEAERSLEQSLAALDGLDASAAHVEYTSTLTDVLNSLAILYRTAGRYDDSERSHRRVIAICQQQIDSDVDRVDSLDQLGTSGLNLGNLYMAKRQYDDASWAYGTAADAFNQLESDFPLMVQYHRRAARALMSLGTVHGAMDDDEAAETAYVGALEKYQALDDEHGATDATLSAQSLCFNNLGNLYADQDRFAESISALNKAVAIREQLASRPHGNPQYRKSAASSKANLANAYRKQGKLDEASALFEEAYQDMESLITAQPRNPSYPGVAVWIAERLSELFIETQQFAEVVSWMRRTIKLLPESPKARVSAAAQLALAAAAARDVDSVGTPDRDALAHEAITMLEEAIQLGWQPENPLATDERFETLTDYDEFIALID